MSKEQLNTVECCAVLSMSSTGRCNLLYVKHIYSTCSHISREIYDEILLEKLGDNL